MLDFIGKMALRVSNWALQGVHGKMHDKQFLEKEIAKWKNSPQRIMQIKGHLYFDNEHDILTRKRTMIGEDGKLEEVENLPNNRIIDNQYPERKIAAIYSKRDLEKLFNLQSMRSSLKNITIDKKIAGRYYQEAAVRAVCESFDDRNRRKAWDMLF